MKTSIILSLISIFLILSYVSPSMAISSANSSQPAGTSARFESFFHENRPAVLSTLQLIAGIDNPGRNTYKTIKFTLKKNRILRLYALGKGKAYTMLDYGGIEDSTTGQLIWVMRFLSTEHGGGIKEIRKVDRILPLKAGTYRLHFKTNTLEPSSNRIQVKSDSFNRGIWLFDVTEHHIELLDSFWEEAICPEEFGWLSAKLNGLIPELEKFGTDALMVITDGKVIFEYGSTTNIIRSHSMRKSLLSALYGIYTANGKIDTNATLEQLEITESTSMTSQEKQATVLDLLKARSGVYIPAAAEAPSMRKARPQRGRHKPGTFWYYNNWDFNVLGTIFRQETSQDIYQAFEKHIAVPIGMQDFILDRQAYNYEKKYSEHPAYPFIVSARDMAKFGQLFLQQGRWNDNQIIPEDWITASTASYSQTQRSGIGYGYMWWVLTEDAHGLKKGCYFADGYGGQRLYVIPHINSVVVHRINIKVPGTNVIFSELAPNAVIKRIMKAYTGKINIQAKSKFREKRAIVVEKRLLDYYGRPPKYYGKSFQWFRTGFWICAAVLTSGLVIWTMIYLVRKFFYRLQAQESNAGKGILFAVMLKWIAAIGGLICSVYIFVILNIQYAFEYVAMVGMPGNLDLHQKILIHVPKLSVLLTFILLIANILTWTKQYWTIFERIHFVLITIAAVIFTSLAYSLNLIILM
jgi:CubicO group peptidase (beta-lactamase class C family)